MISKGSCESSEDWSTVMMITGINYII